MNLQLARHQWEDGRRAVDQLRRRDRKAWELANTQVGIVTAELTRRIGKVFTMDQLADLYETADRWVIETVYDALPDSGQAHASIAADAAFDRYAHGASDWSP